jgi:hypothetical protein
MIAEGLSDLTWMCVFPVVESNMNLRLANGVNVVVTDVEGKKMVIFDRNVRLLGLEAQEARQIGISLYRAKKGTVTPLLMQLVESGFLSKPRSFPEIRHKIMRGNPRIRPSSLMMGLQALLDNGIISRSGKQGTYTYAKA